MGFYPYQNYLKRKAEYEQATNRLNDKVKPKECEQLLLKYGYEKANTALSLADLIRRGIPLEEIKQEFGGFDEISKQILDTVETDAKYEGYLQKCFDQIEKAKRLEEKLLPDDIDYLSIQGLRLEARQKLDKIRPRSLGQAGRISGVSPADVAVLMVYINK